VTNSGHSHNEVTTLAYFQNEVITSEESQKIDDFVLNTTK